MSQIFLSLSKLNLPKRLWRASIILLFLVLSISSWLISYRLGLTTSYNDVMSHLNISRMVFDNLEPGLSQLGGVWLPLNHLLFLPFIWNDWAWHSGFAGSIISMISYLIGVWSIYLIVKETTSNRLASMVAALAFGINLNILYLQTTALTEPLYLMFFLLSALMFIRWIKRGEIIYLILLGVFGFFQVLTRYDGWFVVALEAWLLLLHQIIYFRQTLSKMIGQLTLFLFPVGFGIGLWLLWNLLIFKDILYFALGPYSAHAQQALIENRTPLLSKGSLYYSLLAYSYAVLDNIGPIVSILGLIGGGYFFLKRKLGLSQINKTLLLIFLGAPIIFNILALFLGFSILNVPELHWKPSTDPSAQWFNVRYGILALPIIAIGIGFLSSYRKYLAYLVIILLILQQGLIYQSGIITVIDGTHGSSSFANRDVAQEMKLMVKPEDKVLMSTAFFNSVSFVSQLPLNQFIHEGVSKKWQSALNTPENYVKWIVLANGDVGDPVYTALVKDQRNRFLSLYKLVYQGAHANIYTLKSDNELFVRRDGKTLTNNRQTISLVGVNSYDLAYKSDQEIKKDFEQLSQAHVNTIRFWLFGDGTPDGFQPQSGVTSEARLRQVDYIIATARQYNIRLIPVLSNNWTDYGGKDQYLAWVGKSTKNEDEFYSDPDIVRLFKNYINKVITRQNTITHRSYADEPSILAWDIMNEPRISDPADKQLLIDWTTDISSYIRSLDKNHLITIGTERALSDQDINQSASICNLTTIDLCSVHLYLDNAGAPLFSSQTDVTQLISDQKSYANSVNKPIIIEEVGISKSEQPFNQNPQAMFQSIIKSIRSNQYNGALIWNWALTSDDTFGFSPTGNSTGQYNLKSLETLLQLVK